MTTGPWRAKPTDVRASLKETEERRRQAATARAQALPWHVIQERFGYATRGEAIRDVLKYCEAIREETAQVAEGVIQLELDKLDALERALWKIVNKQHITIQHGRVVVDPATGEMIPDDAPTMLAIDRLVKISERRAKLLGLDTATRFDMAVSDDTNNQIRDLIAQMQGEPEIVQE